MNDSDRTVTKRAQSLHHALADAQQHLEDSGCCPYPAQPSSGWHNRYTNALRTDADAPLQFVRTIHHMACTGGTLISKALQAQPNAQVLSEVDPFSTIPRDHQHRGFAPSDLILLARSGLDDLDSGTIESMFLASLKVLHKRCISRGKHLVVRDHSHSQFCTEVNHRSRPSIREAISEQFSIRSVVTVRHPIDSWASLSVNGWRHFSPYTLEEYSRRYWRFLDTYEGVEIIKYEEFTAAPDQVMRRLCELLILPYNNEWQTLLPAIKLTGDSGRSSNHIAARPRRTLSQAMIAEAQQSPTYAKLCDRLGYEDVVSLDDSA